MDRKSDEELMLDYSQGDCNAFEMLYSRHKDPLYRYLLRQCGQQAIADELFQDVWVKLIGARKRYTVKARFTTYLYHMTHNLMIDYYRRQGRASMVSMDDDPPINCMDGDNPQELTDNPLRQVIAHEQLQSLKECIAALPDEQREAFLLKEEGGLDIDEIAAVTQVKPETAKSRLRYALRKLRATLKEIM